MSTIFLATHAKSAGNIHFLAKDFALVLTSYSDGINHILCTNSSPDAKLLTALYSNRAACNYELGNPDHSASDCRSALGYDPLHLKSYYRLARSLKTCDTEAGLAVFAAISLSRGKPGKSLIQLYDSVRSSCISLQLPVKHQSITLLHPGEMGVYNALEKGRTAVCLAPGIYEDLIQFNSAGRLIICGLGSVTIKPAIKLTPRIMNTVNIDEKATAYFSNITFSGGKKNISQAAVCVTGKASTVHGSRFEDYEGAALCSAGSPLTVLKCVFTSLPHMAIEVREGGSLVADLVVATNCRKGILVYGGATSCAITNSML